MISSSDQRSKTFLISYPLHSNVMDRYWDRSCMQYMMWTTSMCYVEFNSYRKSSWVVNHFPKICHVTMLNSSRTWVMSYMKSYGQVYTRGNPQYYLPQIIPANALQEIQDYKSKSLYSE